MKISFSIIGGSSIAPVRMAQCSSSLPWLIASELSFRLPATESQEVTYLAHMVEEHATTRSTEASLGRVSLLTLAVVYFWLRPTEFDALGIVDHETGTAK